MDNTIKPWLIFILGTSCSGKSSFIRAVNTDEYINLDDAKPLYKFFTADEMLITGQGNFDEFISQNNISDFYKIKQPHSKPVETGGYRITNPAVWDYILQLTAMDVKPGNKYILEFARGVDPEYINAFSIKPEDVYERSIGTIIQNIPTEFRDKSLIISIHADFDNRLARNHERRRKGGHFVSENSMKTIYKSDIFKFDTADGNTGMFNNIPVYSFENAETKNETQEKDNFIGHYQTAIAFYNKVKNER
jgi:hypothetical protein